MLRLEKRSINQKFDACPCYPVVPGIRYRMVSAVDLLQQWADCSESNLSAVLLKYFMIVDG